MIIAGTGAKAYVSSTNIGYLKPQIWKQHRIASPNQHPVASHGRQVAPTPQARAGGKDLMKRENVDGDGKDESKMSQRRVNDVEVPAPVVVLRERTCGESHFGGASRA